MAELESKRRKVWEKLSSAFYSQRRLIDRSQELMCEDQKSSYIAMWSLRPP